VLEDQVGWVIRSRFSSPKPHHLKFAWIRIKLFLGSMSSSSLKLVHYDSLRAGTILNPFFLLRCGLFKNLRTWLFKNDWNYRKWLKYKNSWKRAESIFTSIWVATWHACLSDSDVPTESPDWNKANTKPEFNKLLLYFALLNTQYYPWEMHL